MIDIFDLMLIKTKDEFEYWLFHKNNHEQAFIEFMKMFHKIDLDYSSDSVNLLENWFLNRYTDLDSALRYDQISILSGASLYVGSYLHDKIGGKFTIEVNDKDNVYWGIPMVKNLKKYEVPLVLITTSIDRRLGNFINSRIESLI